MEKTGFQWHVDTIWENNGPPPLTRVLISYIRIYDEANGRFSEDFNEPSTRPLEATEIQGTGGKYHCNRYCCSSSQEVSCHYQG